MIHSHSVKKDGEGAKAFYLTLDQLGIRRQSGFIDHASDQTQTCYHLFDPGSARSCTVLFHGTGNDALFAWEELTLALLRRGDAVFTFDLDGHGQNSSTQLNSTSFSKCGAFLPELLPRLLPELQSVDALAYSLGCLVALRLAVDKHMQWRKMILMALPAQVQISGLFVWRELSSLVSRTFWRQVRIYGWKASVPAFGPFRRQSFPIRLDPSCGLSYLRWVDRLLQTQKAELLLEQLSMPILLIAGSNDSLATAEYGQSLRKACQRGEFVLIDRANHFLLPLFAQTIDTVIRWRPIEI